MKIEDNSGPLANHLLASLARSHVDEVFPLLKSIAVSRGTVLQDPGEDAKHVYFPHGGQVALLMVMKDGRAVQTASIGAEGAINALYVLEQRLARWLLQSSDDGETVSATQETMAQMLGVTRGSVSEAAQTLQVRGLVRHRRGRVDILDRDGLEKAACECYAAVRNAAHFI